MQELTGQIDRVTLVRVLTSQPLAFVRFPLANADERMQAHGMQTERPEYLTAEQLAVLPIGTIVHRPKVAIAFKRVAEGWRQCSQTGRALPNSPAYSVWQLAAEGVAL